MTEKKQNMLDPKHEFMINNSSTCGSSSHEPRGLSSTSSQHEHQQDEQGHSPGEPSLSRRGAAGKLDNDRAPIAVGRSGPISDGAGGHREQQDRVADLGAAHQQGQGQESKPDRGLPGRDGYRGDRERDDPSAGATCAPEGACFGDSGGGRPCGLREARGPGIPGHQPIPAHVPGVGVAHRLRGEWVRLPAASIGQVASREPHQDRRGRGPDQAQGHTEEDNHQLGGQQLGGKFNDSIGSDRQGHGGDSPEPDECDAEPPGEGIRSGGEPRTPSQERQQQGDRLEGQQRGLPDDSGQGLSEEAQEPPRLLDYEAQSTQLSAGRASQLEQQSWEIVPGLFQSLVGHGRLVMLEVGGEPNSYLTTAVQDLVGHAEAAKQLSMWNGADLGSQEGLKFVLQQIVRLRPGLVWLAPSDTPFSPLQHVNSRTDAQKEELKQKRACAQRTFVGAAIVYRFCMQQGVHCVWSMSEKSDAWRLPILQQLLQHESTRQAVTHGCQVGLRGKQEGQLVKKGWKLITTHTRLAQVMNNKCNCHKKYIHGRCEGEVASRSMHYTEQYARRAAEVITMELSHADVGRECQGYSSLPEGFGEGGTCECHKGLFGTGVRCGWCLQGDLQIFDQASGIQGDPTPKVPQEQVLEPENPDEESYSAQEVIAAEEKAKELLVRQDYSEAACLELVHVMPVRAHVTRVGKLGQEKHHYHLFGSYAHGAQYGVSNRTRRFRQCVRYLNQFVRARVPENRRWTSLVLSVNNNMPLHRDVNNEANPPNIVVGFGSYQGGGLWVQETVQAREMGLENKTQQQLTKKTTPHGEEIWGRICETKNHVVTFPPKAWHETESWSGERVVLSAYTSRGQEHLSQEDLEDLRRTGFPIPPRPRRAFLGVMAAEGRESESEKKKEEERIKRQLYLLHSATGHCSKEHLLAALKRRNARPEVLKLAAEFRCSICEERQRVQPRHLSSLEPLPPKFHTVSADVGHWVHPETKEQHQFLVIIDEGSRFRIARFVSKGPKQQPSGATCVQYLREGWAQVFGNPRTLRLDPAGSFRSQAVKDFCDRHQVFLDLVPGEAHWKVGVCEQAVQGLKSVMDKLCQAEGTLSAEEALATAVRVFNQRDLIRGFAPAQHVLGQAPDETGRIDVAVPAIPPELLVENPGTEFSQAVARRTEAEKAHAEWNARQRLVRAANSRGRRVLDYHPGELVYFWRVQDSSKNRQGPTSKRGQFMGPARILATETKRNPDGTLQPGSTVWCVRGRQLVKCCVEQLRKASPREELIDALAQDDKTPWTFTRVAEQIGGNQYEDVSSDAPQLEEWLRAQNPEEEVQPHRRRITFKRPAPPAAPDDSEEELIPDRSERERPSSRATSSRSNRRPHPYGASVTETGEHWWDKVAEEAWFCSESSYWSDKRASVQVEVDLPQTQSGWSKALQNFEGYLVSAMRRRAVEVREKHLTEEERLAFQGAKAVEVKNFVAARAFEALPENIKPNKEQAIGMRWILTWKQKEDGTVKAKARAVLLGYQDPSYEHRQTTAPVMSRQARQMLLQQAARRKWTVFKGDVSGAFLQGRDYPGILHCTPCDEICDALGVPRNSIMRLRRACYGLVDAPLEWYRSVAEFLESLGLERTWSDPCTWVWRVQGELKGMISGHVDDFMFGGSDQDREWQNILTQIKARFQWGDWERDTEGFTQCGVRIVRTEAGYELSQPQFVEALKEIPLNASRRKDRKEETTERERTQLRAALGSLSWLAQQSSPHLSASVSLLLSEVSTSTIDTVIRVNMLINQVKKRKEHTMLIHSFAEDEPLALYSWVDAASANRPDGGSTQGIFIGLGPQNVLQGALGKISPMAWHSSKVDRVCRSPGAAEAQAAANGEDSLYYARYQWSELEFGNVDPRAALEVVRRVPGCLITDSRNVYDKLNTEVLIVKGAEKRTDLELMGLKESQYTTDLSIRWVHSEAQLANSLTKAGGGKEIEMYYQMRYQWRIVEDEQMRSARRRRQDGVAPLAAGEEGE